MKPGPQSRTPRTGHTALHAEPLTPKMATMTLVRLAWGLLLIAAAAYVVAVTAATLTQPDGWVALPLGVPAAYFLGYWGIGMTRWAIHTLRNPEP